MPTPQRWLANDRPTLMAVVNVNADSFSDPRQHGPADPLAMARQARHDGAAVIDLGAQSAALAAALVPAQVQRDALVPLVAELAGDGAIVSVDTYDPLVATATLAAGATILNDYSGRCEPALVAAVVDADAHYVLTHNPVGPRQRQTDPSFYGDVVDDVVRFFETALIELATAGLPADRVVLDPGVDVAKTPAQSLALLRGADRLRAAFDNPLLWAISRKDVVGAVTGRTPAQRDPGTLALVARFATTARTLLRVHDVRGAVDHLAMVDALDGRSELPTGLLLDDALRREVD